MINPQRPHDGPKKIFAVIHGHFYQPPRENPWTQTIPLQDSAKPYHDWNERITVECYKPNTRSRMLDGHGKITSLENNFAHLSFNIGPTLFTWLEQRFPDVYQRILEGDRTSCGRQQGHGNAIAQVYNHVILPLANDRDKITQILWGVREFEHRYGRKPESIWLAETAINDATIRCLIEQGVKYVILSPTQAQRIRTIGTQAWRDVSDNSIDITQPYRIFGRESNNESAKLDSTRPEAGSDELRNVDVLSAESESANAERFSSERYLDVFFYDGALSNDMSFNHLLRDPHVLLQKINDIAGKSAAPHVLVHVATDGEIYGHHESFGDMSLTALLTAKLPSAHIEVTNYGSYLELHPPTMQVVLKPGSHAGEGTAWSCAHGVGRWYRDCGCNISNPPGWNQAWRTPLRKGFDRLRDALSEAFERLGGPLLRDPWQARNAYIRCILEPTDAAISHFLDEHAAHPLNDEEQALVLRLLEAQKYSLLTYTSCAWFFNDVSGLEPLQNMRYAARALQLVAGLVADDLETQVLAAFAEAVSNVSGFGTGRDLYLKHIKPDVFTPERAANQFLVEALLQKKPNGKASSKRNTKPAPFIKSEQRIHIYHVRAQEPFFWHDLVGTPAADAQSAESSAASALSVIGGLLHVTDTTTRYGWDLMFSAFLDDRGQPVAYLKRCAEAAEVGVFKSAMTQACTSGTIVIESQAVASFLMQAGFSPYGLADFYHEDREHLFSTMLDNYSQRVEDHLETVYTESLTMLDELTAANLEVPARLHASVEFSLTSHLMIEMEKLYAKAIGQYSPASLTAAIAKILHLSQAHHLILNTDLLRTRLTGALTQYVVKLSTHFLSIMREQPEHLDAPKLEGFLGILRDTFELIEQGEKLGVAVDKTELQNMAYEILESSVPRYLALLNTALEQAEQTESESAHQQLHCFFREYKFLRECLKLASRLHFNIDRYREILISAELGKV